jgi:hypothetical protein
MSNDHYFCKLHNNNMNFYQLKYLIGTLEWTYDVISASGHYKNSDDVKKTKRKIVLIL